MKRCPWVEISEADSTTPAEDDSPGPESEDYDDSQKNKKTKKTSRRHQGKISQLVLLTLLLSRTPLAQALTAFDCEHPNTTYQVVDLMAPAPCPDPERDYEPGRPQRLQLLQTDGQMPVTASKCQVTISKKVTRCGFNSLVYGSKWTVWQKDHELTPRECRQAVANGMIQVGHRAFKAQLNVKTTHLFYSMGGLDDDMNCNTVSSFESGGRWFRKSYEHTTLTVELQTVRGTVDQSTGEVVFTNGIRAVYKDQVIRDAIEGTLVWKAVEPECSTTVSELFQGKGVLHRRKEADNLRGAIVLIQNNQTGQYAGLVLKDVITTCKVRCFNTQIRGLVVCPYRDGDEPLPRHSFKAHFEQSHVDLQTQLGYLHTMTNMATADRFAVVQAELCQLDRRTLSNKLQVISGSQNYHALLDLYGPGYQVYKAGAVAYLTKCVAVEVNRVDFQNCTHELPVVQGNDTMFMDPFTRIVTTYPTIIPCSDLMPSRWRIAGNWYCAHPTVLPCQAPVQLNSTITSFQPLTDFVLGMGQGVYSQAQKQQHRLFQLSQASRRPVVAKLTNAATDNGHAGHLGLPLSLGEMPTLSMHMAFHLFPIIYYLGEAWIYVSTFLWIALICKIGIGSGIRAFVAYRRYGCGRWVVFALWETAFVIITTPWRLLTQTAAALTAPLEENGLELSTTDSPSAPLSGNPEFEELRRQLRQLQVEMGVPGVEAEVREVDDRHDEKPGGTGPSILVFPPFPHGRDSSGQTSGTSQPPRGHM